MPIQVMESFAKLQQSSSVQSGNDNSSDISTEHSINSEDEENNENAEENLVEDSLDMGNDTNNVTGNDVTLARQTDAAEERLADLPLAEERETPNIQSDTRSTNEAIATETSPYPEAHSTTPAVPCNLLIPFTPIAPIPAIIDEQKLTEEYINEISSTTFQFNVDQMKHGDSSKYYSEIIVLNSDDESDDSGDCNSSDDVIDVDNSHFAFSSKLDDFLITKFGCGCG